MDVRQEPSQKIGEIDLAHQTAFTLGALSVSPSTREVRSADSEQIVEPRVMQALVCLARSEGAVVSRDDLIRCCWGGRIVGDDAINRCIGKVRQIADMANGASFAIETIPRVGYRLRSATPPASASDAPPPISVAGEAAPQSRPAIADTPVAPPLTNAPIRPRSARRWLVPAAALAVVLAIGYSALRFFHPDRVAPRLSIAVLPFRDLGGDSEDDYLADAVGDDLTTDLSHLPGSVVIARTSVEAYKTRAADVGQIGRELGVRYLLQGSLRRAGDSLFINAQLIDTATGAQLWAERFDAPRRQLADTQTTIVRHIASALHFTLVQIEGRRSLRDRPDDPDALDLFLRARSLVDRDDTMKGLINAQALLEKAIAAQPDFVDAMSELAWLLLRKARDFDDPTDAEDMAGAGKLIARAVELAPHNARALAARGFLLKLDGRCEEAIASYRLALTFDANDTDARDGIALCAANLGHADEALRQLQETLLIDPQDPKNRIRYNQLGLVSLMLGHGPEAIDWFLKASAGDPDPEGPNDSLSRQEWNEVGLIAAYGVTGRPREARARYEHYARLWPRRTVWRLASYFTAAEAALPGFAAMRDALKAAGMPAYADESLDGAAAPSSEPRIAGDFDPTPATLPGARTVATPELASLLSGDAPPAVIDVGCGAAVIPGAAWVKESFPSEEGLAHLKSALAGLPAAAPDRRVVVMGSGKYDWNGYNAALALTKLGYRDVSWYRGGEEAWAAAGMKSVDRRDP